jgi:hypothetical protein
VLVRVEESFTFEPGGLAAHSELALFFELRDGLITRLLVIEDPPVSAALPRNAGTQEQRGGEERHLVPARDPIGGFLCECRVKVQSQLMGNPVFSPDG